MVAFALVGVGDGEVGDGLVEGVALPQVAADLGRRAGPRVRVCEGPSTQLGVLARMTPGVKTSTIGLIFMSLS